MNNTTSRPLVNQAITALYILDTLGSVFFVSLIVLITWGIWERRRSMDLINNPGSRGSVWLLLLAMLQVSFFAVEYSMYSNDYSSPERFTSCQAQAKFLPTAWVISKQLSYVSSLFSLPLTLSFRYTFLFERAVVVHRSIMHLNKWFFRFRNFVGFIIVIGVAGIFYWATISKFEGLVYSPEGVCVMYTEATYILIMFAACDLLLSVALLFLFLYPLQQHMSNMQNHGLKGSFQNQLQQLLRKNIQLSCCITVSALLALIVMLVLILMAEREEYEAERDHLIIYALFGPTIDTILCCVFLLRISDLWKPSFLKTLLSNGAKSIKTSSNELKTKPKCDTAPTPLIAIATLET